MGCVGVDSQTAIQRFMFNIVYLNSGVDYVVAMIGLFGALPVAGGNIAALLNYYQAKRSVKKPSEPFGKGALEGIIATESANNAAIGGAFIPMLTLGIPGDAVRLYR